MVKESASNTIQLWLARCGMFGVVGYVVGWGILGMCIPPFILKSRSESAGVLRLLPGSQHPHHGGE